MIPPTPLENIKYLLIAQLTTRNDLTDYDREKIRIAIDKGYLLGQDESPISPMMEKIIVITMLVSFAILFWTRW